MNRKFTRAFIGDSSYAMLLYLLTCTKEEIESTYFFFSDGMPKHIRNNMEAQMTYFSSMEFLNKSLFNWKRLIATLKLRFTASRKWPILKTGELYGQEIAWYAPALIGWRKFVCYEDGLSSYILPKQGFIFKLKSIVKAIIIGISAYPGWSGRCKQSIKENIFTGIKDSGYRKDIPYKIINIQELWDKSSEDKKKKILGIYGVTEADKQALSSRTMLLLTQPLSQDGIITEEERIALYKDLIKGCDYNQIIIKTHPREILVPYEKIFPGVYVFNKKVPMQLLKLLNLNYKKVYTLFSTSAFDFMDSAEIIFAGTEVHPNCVKRYGIISLPKK